jgi:hypothetical protein
MGWGYLSNLSKLKVIGEIGTITNSRRRYFRPAHAQKVRQMLSRADAQAWSLCYCFRLALRPLDEPNGLALRSLDEPNGLALRSLDEPNGLALRSLGEPKGLP